MLLKFSGLFVGQNPIGPLWVQHMPGTSAHPKPKSGTQTARDPTIGMDEVETATYILGSYWGMEDLQGFVVLVVVLNQLLR